MIRTFEAKLAINVFTAKKKTEIYQLHQLVNKI